MSFEDECQAWLARELARGDDQPPIQVCVVSPKTYEQLRRLMGNDISPEDVRSPNE